MKNVVTRFRPTHVFGEEKCSGYVSKQKVICTRESCVNTLNDILSANDGATERSVNQLASENRYWLAEQSKNVPFGLSSMNDKRVHILIVRVPQ